MNKLSNSAFENFKIYSKLRKERGKDIYIDDDDESVSDADDSSHNNNSIRSKSIEKFNRSLVIEKITEETQKLDKVSIKTIHLVYRLILRF